MALPKGFHLPFTRKEITLSGGLSRLWHKFLKQEDFLSYNFATLLTFQF